LRGARDDFFARTTLKLGVESGSEVRGEGGRDHRLPYYSSLPQIVDAAAVKAKFECRSGMIQINAAARLPTKNFAE
jgi:hypothetical protein